MTRSAESSFEYDDLSVGFAIRNDDDATARIKYPRTRPDLWTQYPRGSLPIFTFVVINARKETRVRSRARPTFLFVLAPPTGTDAERARRL